MPTTEPTPHAEYVATHWEGCWKAHPYCERAAIVAWLRKCQLDAVAHRIENEAHHDGDESAS